MAAAPALVPGSSGSSASPQLISPAMTTPSSNFPSSTSNGSYSAPATGASPQLVPTVGSTAGPSANTPIPGATQVSPTDKNTIAGVQSNEQVSSNLDSLLASGSPYIDLAKSTAQQASAARGLQNSSIAAGAGEAAAIQASLPIAQQDASTALTTQTNNLAALNQSAQIAQTAEQSRTSTAQQIAEQTAGTEQATQQQIAEQTAGTEEQQRQQIAEQTAGTLSTQAQQGQITQQTQALQGQIQSGLQAQQGQINYQLQAQTEQANINQILTQGNVNSMLSSQQAAEQIQQLQQTNQNALSQIAAQAQANASQDGPALQAQYLTGVTNIMNATAAQIQQIYATTGLTPAQQQNAVTTANAQMEQNINNLAAFYAASPLWDTGQNPAPIPNQGEPGSPANPQGNPGVPTATPPAQTPAPTTPGTHIINIPGVGSVTVPNYP